MTSARFVAGSMREAIRRVRAELGGDAVILSSRPTAGGVEITAALGQPAPVSSNSAGAADAGVLEEMRHEIRTLRGLLEHQLSRLEWDELERRQPVRSGVLRRLMGLGLRRAAASAVAERVPARLAPAPAWQCALDVLASRIDVTGDALLEEGGVFALVGATGVGKTTTVAKLAARYSARHGARQVGLVTTDGQRAGACEQLHALARCIDAEVQVADDARSLRAALERFRERRLVLIDTAGTSQRDVRFSEQIRMLGHGSPRVRIFLALSATTQQLALNEALRAFEGSRPDGCVVTKLDECTSLGNALSFLLEQRAPVAYVTDGQRIPEDIRPASAGEIVLEAAAIAERHAPHGWSGPSAGAVGEGRA